MKEVRTEGGVEKGEGKVKEKGRGKKKGGGLEMVGETETQKISLMKQQKDYVRNELPKDVSQFLFRDPSSNLHQVSSSSLSTKLFYQKTLLKLSLG